MTFAETFGEQLGDRYMFTLPPMSSEESARRILEQLAVEKMGKVIMKGEVDGNDTRT